jgi:hypothetical protein
MTTDIAINGTISSVLPGDVHRVNETTSSVLPDDLYRVSRLQYQWSSERETILNIIEVTVNSIKIVW